jgi:hypothetical protein
MSPGRRTAALVAIGLLTVATGCGAAPAGAIPGVVSTAAAGAIATGGAQQTGAAAQTAGTFLSDLDAGKCAAAYALVVDPLRTRAGTAAGLCAAVPAATSFTVGATTTLTSTSAFVIVSVVGGSGATANVTITLLFQTPHWYVSDVVAGGSASPGPDRLQISNLEATVEQQFAAQGGGATITVTCPQPGTAVASAGQQFQCTFSASNGRSGTLTVNVGSGGYFSWSIP